MKKDFGSYEIILNSINLLSYYKNIEQKEVDYNFYKNDKKEIAYFFYPDNDKINQYFKDNLDSLEARLAVCGMAYDEDIVLICSDTFKANQSISNNKTIFKIFFDEISFEANNISGYIPEDKINSSFVDITPGKDQKDMQVISEYSYLVIGILDELIFKLNDIKKDIINIESYTNKNIVGKNIYYNYDKRSTKELLLMKLLNIIEEENGGYYIFSKHIEAIEKKYKDLLMKVDYMLIDGIEEYDKINEQLLKFRDDLRDSFNEVDHGDGERLIIFFEKLKEVVIPNIISFYKNQKTLLTSVQTKDKSIPIDKKAFTLKSIKNDTNNIIFLYLSNFIKKYFSDYYMVDNDRIISIGDLNTSIFNEIIENIKNDKSDNLEEFSIKESSLFSLKYNSIENKENKLDFFSSFLYKNFIGIHNTKILTYLKLKNSIIEHNLDSLNNKNYIYIEKSSLDSKLTAMQNVKVDLFGGLFYISDNDSDNSKKKTKKKYYSICDLDGNNKSNPIDIKSLFNNFVFFSDILKKYEIAGIFKDFYEEVTGTLEYRQSSHKIKLIDYIKDLEIKKKKGANESLEDEEKNNTGDAKIKLLLKIKELISNAIKSNIAIHGFTLTGRREVNKGTGKVTPLFQIHSKIYSIAYNKLFEQTRENLIDKVGYISGNSITKVNFSNLEDDFVNLIQTEINESFEDLMTRAHKNCEVMYKEIS